MVKQAFCILAQIGVLYLHYFIGSLIQKGFDLPISGSILGMLLFFALLTVWKPFERFVEKGANVILAHLPLFFTPATVGVMIYFDLFKGSGVLLVIITILSTLIVLVGSAYTTRLVHKARERARG